eukprot:4086065-Pyramimonas_sp.AAC.3
MSERKAVIKNADMSEDMQQDAIDCATQALEKYNIEKDIAAYIKKEFDKKYNPTWHCIVGRNFGSYVTHETKHFIYFYLGQDFHRQLFLASTRSSWFLGNPKGFFWDIPGRSGQTVAFSTPVRVVIDQFAVFIHGLDLLRPCFIRAPMKSSLGLSYRSRFDRRVSEGSGRFEKHVDCS